LNEFKGFIEKNRKMFETQIKRYSYQKQN